MRIFIDMDETTVDLFSDWLSLYNHDYNDTLTIEGVTTWDVAKFAKPECGVKIYEYLYQKGLFKNLKALPGATGFVRKLHEDGHEVHLVTASPGPVAAKEKLEWVADNFPFLPDRRVMTVYDKWLLDGDIIIDDKPLTLEKFKGHSLSLMRPWSDISLEKIGVRYFENYDDIYEHINYLAMNDDVSMAKIKEEFEKFYDKQVNKENGLWYFASVFCERNINSVNLKKEKVRKFLYTEYKNSHKL